MSSTLGSGCLQLANLIEQYWIDGSIHYVQAAGDGSRFLFCSGPFNCGKGEVVLSSLDDLSVYIWCLNNKLTFTWKVEHAPTDDSPTYLRLNKRLFIPQTRGFAMMGREEFDE